MAVKLNISAIVLAFSLFTNAASADVVAVVSPRNPVTSLTLLQLTDIYLGRSARFPDGTKAIPCDLAENSPLREEFYTTIIGKSQAQIKSHWSKLIFTGRGQPPLEVATDAGAKQLVTEKPNVICYIDRSQVDKSVTVLFPK